MAKPIKTITRQQLPQVEALAAYLTSEQIADYFSIGRSRFYELLKENQELKECYDRGRVKAVGSVAQTLVKQALEGNTTAAIFFLKTKGGWKEASILEHTGSDGGPILIGKEFDKL
jgi:hypothetical protein